MCCHRNPKRRILGWGRVIEKRLRCCCRCVFLCLFARCLWGKLLSHLKRQAAYLFIHCVWSELTSHWSMTNHATAWLSYRQGIRQSVPLLHAGIDSKLTTVGSCGFHQRIAQRLCSSIVNFERTLFIGVTLLHCANFKFNGLSNLSSVRIFSRRSHVALLWGADTATLLWSNPLPGLAALSGID